MSGPLPRLIAITDLEQLAAPVLLARVEALLSCAAPHSVAILLRDHQASARQRLALGETLRELTRQAEQELWVADRLDLALLLEADGVHLGEGSVPAPVARAFLGPAPRLSRAWHVSSLADAAVELACVDALLVSPICEPRKGRVSLGVAALTSLARALQARSNQPVLYALGGVTALTARACLAAGAHGIAAIGAALQADPTPLFDALEIRRAATSPF